MTLKFLIAALLVCSVAAMGAPPPLLVLDQHDYVFPRLSPDGRHLVVARAIQRPDATETTDAVLVDLASGASRELISQREAEANETYETFVIGLRWLDDRRVEVSLSDGDVGGADLIVDVDTGKLLSTDYEGDGDSLVPSTFAEIAADARFYSRHFSREELEQSLGTSGCACELVRGAGSPHRESVADATGVLFRAGEAAREANRVGTRVSEAVGRSPRRLAHSLSVAGRRRGDRSFVQRLSRAHSRVVVSSNARRVRTNRSVRRACLCFYAAVHEE